MPDFSLEPTPHEEAIALIKGKPAVSRRVFDQMLPELRGRVFTITGVEGVNILERARDAIAKLPEGQTWEESKKGLLEVISPFFDTEPTGEDGEGPSAAERRAELLLRTHGFQAFNAANYRVIQEDDDSTHIQYIATEDDATRDAHMALHGVTLPKDDPFWAKHTPPWDWGCRCRIRAMNPDLVDELREEDADRAPDAKLLVEGPALKKLRDGLLIRDGQVFDVTAPADSNKENAFQWHPDDLRVPLDQLEKRYAPEEWKTFKAFAEQTEILPGKSVWDWLGGAELKPKRAKGTFPETITGLEKVRSLGGSTGAELVRDPETGDLFVLKRGNSPVHVREEFAADELYRALGAAVPPAKLFEEADRPVKLARYIEGATLNDYLKKATAAERTAVLAKLQENFAADALLGNWDVAGLGLDNIVVDAAGVPWRIDNGGSLRYRAQGTAKTAEEWNAFPKELWSMRDAKQNPKTAQIFGGADFYDVAKQIGAIDREKFLAAAPEDLRALLGERLKNLQDVGAKAIEYQGTDFKTLHADRVTQQILGLREAGVFQHMAGELKQPAPGEVILSDESGRAFDHLRSVVQKKAAAPADKSQQFYDQILPAVKTLNHHHAKGDTAYNATNLANALAQKPALMNLALAGTKAEKAMATKYLGVIQQLEASKGNVGTKIEQFEKHKLPAKRTSKTEKAQRSIVSEVADYMEQNGGDWKIVEDWASQQGGSSSSHASQAFKAFLMERLDGVKASEFHSAPDGSALKLKRATWPDKYDRTVEIFQAFVQEVLGRVDFPGNDRAAGLTRVLRTETNAQAVKGIKIGATGEYKRGVNESGSLFRTVFSGARTVTTVPHTRITGIYFTERTPGKGNTFFLGDSENEVTYIGYGLKTLNLGSGGQPDLSPGNDSNAWLKPSK